VFSSINGTFAHLKLVVYARSDVAAATTVLGARFNGDTGANYDSQNVRGAAATPAAGESFASTSMALANSIPGASAPGNLFDGAEAIIPHYANSANNKVLVTANTLKFGTSTGNLNVARLSNFWRSNAAITSVTIFSAPTGNLVAGSAATLLGLP
jgi:hypothetical protein